MIWIPVILILPYLILISGIYRSLRRQKPFSSDKDPITFVSIVVACRNEQENLPRLLNSIATQIYPGNLYEVIVVNDNSADDTFKTAAEFKSINRVIALNNKGTGKKAALRTGIEQASGNLIITTDADCVMCKNWIRVIASFYQEYNPDMIICPVRLKTGFGFFRKFQELEFLSLQGITAGSALSGKAIMCNGANLAFSKNKYLGHSSDLHDEINSGDDIFLLHSFKRELNPKIFWIESPEAIVTTKASASVRSFLQQRKRWISKGTSYTDRDTIIAGISTFSTVLLQISYFIGSLINPSLLPVFLLIFLLKSVPDFLIIRNTVKRYGKGGFLRWFLPAQLIYPFYVLLVLLTRYKSAIRIPKTKSETTEYTESR